MKRIIVLIILNLCISFYILSQVPEWQWAKGAGSIRHEEGSSIFVDADGYTYITGYFQYSSLNFSTTYVTNYSEYGTSDMFVAKYDPAGNVVWARSGGGSKDDYGNGIAVDLNGNVYVTGHFDSPTCYFQQASLTNNNPLNSDIFIVKYNSSGNVVWAKSGGGYSRDLTTSIALDANGNCYITGNYFSVDFKVDKISLPASGGGYDVFVAKYDGATGNAQWAQSLNGGFWDLSNNIKVDINGNVFITGEFQSDSLTLGAVSVSNHQLYYYDTFIAKLSNSGIPIWLKSYGGDKDDGGYGIAVDGSGNCYSTGYFNSSSITFGINILTNTSTGNCDFFVAKYDGAGNVIWAKSAVGNNCDAGYNSAADANGNCYVSGSFRSAAITFGGVTLTNKSTNGSQDVFVVKYNSDGNVPWGKTAGGTGNDWPAGIALDVTNNIYIVGSFLSSSIAFGPISVGNSNTTTTNLFVAKLNSAITEVDDIKDETLIKVFPNPCSDRIFITAKPQAFGEWYAVYDQFGRMLKKGRIDSEKTAIELNQFCDGIYLIGLRSGQRQKFVIHRQKNNALW